MANWESKTLADTEFLAGLSEAAVPALDQLQTALTVVGEGGKIAKVFLTSVANPAAAALGLLADSIISQLRNYQESGWFFLYVDPTNAAYGMKKLADNFGYEKLTDKDGKVLFETSTVMNLDVVVAGRTMTANPLSGRTFKVSEQYRRGLQLYMLGPGTVTRGHPDNPIVTKLDSYYDKFGRDKNDPDFIPPTPKFNEKKIVAGGYDPATWTGDMLPWDHLPIFDAVKCRTVMADAFDDEGDIPKFEITDKNMKRFSGLDNENSLTPHTRSGAALSEYDPDTIFKFPLYASANTARPTSDRGVLTKQIQIGKPNYAGDTSLIGTSIFGLAIIVAAQNPQEFIDSIDKVAKILGGGIKTNMENLKKVFMDMITPEERKITISVDTNHSGAGPNSSQFIVGDIILGDDSGAVGTIAEIGTITPTKMTKYKYITKTNPHTDKPVERVKVKDMSVRATNSDERFKDTEITFIPTGPGIFIHFLPSEKVFEAVKTFRPYPAKNQPPLGQYVYTIKGIEHRGMPSASVEVLPNFGTVLGINAIAPASTPPDWNTLKADSIPGWSDMFEGLIQLATGIKGFAEDTSAFIEALIEAIEDMVKQIEKLINALIDLITLLTIGLPNAGIWILGMETSSGNEGFKNAIMGATGAPDESYKFSCGFCFVGDPVLKDLTGKDPLEVVFGDILGVEFQSV